MDANIQASTIQLTDAEIKEIDELTAPQLTYPKVFVGLQDEVLKNAARS